MKRYLLVTTTLVLFVAGIITLNLNSTVWAKDDDKINSDNFRISENTNGKVNTQTNDDGSTQTTHNRNFQSSTNGSKDCDSECREALDNTMSMLNNLINPNLP